MHGENRLNPELIIIRQRFKTHAQELMEITDFNKNFDDQPTPFLRKAEKILKEKIYINQPDVQWCSKFT